MAELLAAEGWVKSGSAGSYLRENLPDEYIVVADPRVSGQSLAAAVVGRGALFLVEDLNTDQPGEATSGPAPGADGHDTVHAAEEFLKDEFPSLKLFLMAVRSARDWAEGPVTWRVSEPAEWADQPLADAIVAADRAVLADQAAGAAPPPAGPPQRAPNGGHSTTRSGRSSRSACATAA